MIVFLIFTCIKENKWRGRCLLPMHLRWYMVREWFIFLLFYFLLLFVFSFFLLNFSIFSLNINAFSMLLAHVIYLFFSHHCRRVSLPLHLKLLRINVLWPPAGHFAYLGWNWRSIYSDRAQSTLTIGQSVRLPQLVIQKEICHHLILVYPFMFASTWYINEQWNYRHLIVHFRLH